MIHNPTPTTTVQDSDRSPQDRPHVNMTMELPGVTPQDVPWAVYYESLQQKRIEQCDASKRRFLDMTCPVLSSRQDAEQFLGIYSDEYQRVMSDIYEGYKTKVLSYDRVLEGTSLSTADIGIPAAVESVITVINDNVERLSEAARTMHTDMLLISAASAANFERVIVTLGGREVWAAIRKDVRNSSNNEFGKCVGRFRRYIRSMDDAALTAALDNALDSVVVYEVERRYDNGKLSNRFFTDAASAAHEEGAPDAELSLASSPAVQRAIHGMIDIHILDNAKAILASGKALGYRLEARSSRMVGTMIYAMQTEPTWRRLQAIKPGLVRRNYIRKIAGVMEDMGCRSDIGYVMMRTLGLTHEEIGNNPYLGSYLPFQAERSMGARAAAQYGLYVASLSGQSEQAEPPPSQFRVVTRPGGSDDDVFAP